MQALSVLRICRIVQTKNSANCVSLFSQKRNAFLRAFFSYFRGGVLPGIPRPGFIEHFNVPLWVRVFEKMNPYLVFQQAFMTGSVFFFPSCLLSFLGVFLIARNRPKRKEPDRNFIRMEKIPGKFSANPPLCRAPRAETHVCGGRCVDELGCGGGCSSSCCWWWWW